MRNFVRRKHERGASDQLPCGGRACPRIADAARAELRRVIAASPDATLEEAREHLQRQVGVSVGLSAVCRALAKL